MALSMTHFPLTRRTYAVFYGCQVDGNKKDDMTKIANRLVQSSENTFHHPMLLLGVFAETEKERMRGLVRAAQTSMMESVNSLHEVGYGGGIGNGPFLGSAWLAAYEIRNGLEHWQKILLKMADHISELDRDAMSPTADRSNAGEKDFRRASSRIKDRLLEIHLEYDAMIKDCTMVIEGMTINTNLVRERPETRKLES